MNSRAATARDDADSDWTDIEADAATHQSARPTTTQTSDTTEQVRVPSPPAADHASMAGTITVADRVVAEIVGRTVHEVTGVHALVPRQGDLLLVWLRRLAGRDSGIPGVAVRLGRQDVTVSLTISVTYGVSIPSVVDSLRRYVTARVETLTGLAVREVRIDVSGLAFAEDSTPADGKE